MIVSDNKRIAKNTAMLYFRMLITMCVTLYTSRVILNTLGVEDFGIYNVVGGIVIMFTFLNSAMGASTSRFLIFELGRKDYKQLKKVFSASLSSHIGIARIVVLNPQVSHPGRSNERGALGLSALHLEFFGFFDTSSLQCCHYRSRADECLCVCNHCRGCIKVNYCLSLIHRRF
jgi:O-antigen/teichoic acid export membrane protein